MPETLATPTSQTNPRAGEILNGMKKGGSPLDFITKNLKPLEPNLQPQELIAQVVATRTEPDPTAVTPAPVADTSSLFPDPALAKPAEPKTEAPLEVPVADVAPDPDPVPEDPDEALVADVPNIPAAENFKRLRTKAKETSKELIQTKAQMEELSHKLQQYETGEIVPEVLQELENKVQEGEHYKKLHALKFSKEYQDTFVKPLGEISTKLKAIATDYNIPEQVIEEASQITNRADLNRFLSSHFDELGAAEVKQLIGDMNSLRDRAQDAEQEPARMLEQLQLESEQLQHQRQVQRVQKIEQTSKSVWSKAMRAHAETGLATELIERPDDPDFNERFFKPVAQKAATEFGRLVSALAAAGLEDLPEDLAMGLAQMTQYAIAYGVAANTRTAALRHADELEKGSIRAHSLLRPRIGAPGGAGGEAPKAPTTQPGSPQEAARGLMNTIIQRRAPAI